MHLQNPDRKKSNPASRRDSRKKILKPLKKIILLLFIFVILGAAGLLSFLLINYYVDRYAAVYCHTDLAEIPEADAILVLGAFVEENGKISPTLRERLDVALELYNSGKADRIILSGDHGTKVYDEVNAMKEYMMDKGIPRENLFLDHAGFNTYDSMYRAKEIFCVNTLLVCTQRFHINRAVYIARKLGIDAYGYPTDKWLGYYQRIYGIRESIAKAKAFVDVLIKRDPKFLGETIPIHGSGILTEG